LQVGFSLTHIPELADKKKACLEEEELILLSSTSVHVLEIFCPSSIAVAVSCALWTLGHINLLLLLLAIMKDLYIGDGAISSSFVNQTRNILRNRAVTPKV
jgi:hypothetical protein